MHRPRKGLIRALLQFSSEKSDNEAFSPLSVSVPLDDNSRSHQSFGMSFPGLHSIPMHHLTFDLAENTGLSADSFEGFGSRGFHSPLAAIYPFMHFRPETVPHSLVPRSIARWNTLVEHSGDGTLRNLWEQLSLDNSSHSANFGRSEKRAKMGNTVNKIG